MAHFSCFIIIILEDESIDNSTSDFLLVAELGLAETTLFLGDDTTSKGFNDGGVNMRLVVR